MVKIGGNLSKTKFLCCPGNKEDYGNEDNSDRQVGQEIFSKAHTSYLSQEGDMDYQQTSLVGRSHKPNNSGSFGVVAPTRPPICNNCGGQGTLSFGTWRPSYHRAYTR